MRKAIYKYSATHQQLRSASGKTELIVFKRKCLTKSKIVTHSTRKVQVDRSQGLRGLGRGPAAAHLLGLRIRISLGAWVSIY
jgi:hypothetical protein